jgi:hypothetical protein
VDPAVAVVEDPAVGAAEGIKVEYMERDMQIWTPRTRARSGQAMMEVIAGLVVIMVLLIGIVGITSLTRAQTDTLVEARARAGASSLDSTTISAFPQHIADVNAGADGSAYSVDDETTDGDPAAFQNLVVDRTASTPSDWDTLDAVPRSPMTALRTSPSPVAEFGLVEGSAQETIPLLPALRHLLYDAEEITIESRVWMTRTEGIY